jgi:protein-disulfide isomerase
MKKIIVYTLLLSFGVVSPASAAAPVPPDAGSLTTQVERLKQTISQLQSKKTPSEQHTLFSSGVSIPPVSKSDHILGSLNAKIMVVEYSDYECPTCKTHHDTMNEMLSTYASGTVAEVYRHFPVYKKTPEVALAAECAASIGGNTAFWNFNDLYFSSAKFHDKTNIKRLIPKIIAQLKIDKKAFSTCTRKKTFSAAIEADKNVAISNAASGAPWLVFVHKDEIIGTMAGTYLPEDMKLYIDSLLATVK